MGMTNRGSLGYRRPLSADEERVKFAMETVDCMGEYPTAVKIAPLLPDIPPGVVALLRTRVVRLRRVNLMTDDPYTRGRLAASKDRSTPMPSLFERTARAQMIRRRGLMNFAGVSTWISGEGQKTQKPRLKPSSALDKISSSKLDRCDCGCIVRLAKSITWAAFVPRQKEETA
jgi:hypothetical protein